MKPNYAAWSIPKVEWQEINATERLFHLLRYGVLAPSAHNTQPWRFSIDADKNTIGVFFNDERMLPHSDPLHREAYVSIGAAIENICAAAKAYGCKVTVRPTRNKGPRIVILLIKFSASHAVDHATLDAIQNRRTNRAPFDKTPLPAGDIRLFDTISGAGTSTFVVETLAAKKRIGTLAAKATLAQMDKAFKSELSEWVRSAWTNEYTGMPATVQGIPAPVSLLARFMTAHTPIQKSQANKDSKQLQDAPLLVAICASDDDAAHWLEAGRVFERLCLQATKLGLAVSAYASVIEHLPSNKKLQKILGTSEHPMALLRIGKPTKTMPRTPRLPAEQVIAN